MSYAIMRTAKLKDWLAISGSQDHTYRTIPTPNADPSKLHLNRTGVGTVGDVVGDITKRVHAVTDYPRANAVLAVELLLTTSPEWAVGKSAKEIETWAKANLKWLRAAFGKDNVVHVVLHRDETTPHLVAYVVPEKGGRLNCRAILGSRQLLRDLQTSYAAAMEPFGLERGVIGSKATHQTVSRFYGKLNAAEAALEQSIEELEEISPPPEKSLWKRGKGHQEAKAEWEAKETGKRKKLVRHAAAAILEASEAQEAVATLKQVNSSLTAALGATKADLSVAYEALGLGREDIVALRKADTTLVAQRLGHMGAVLPKENAIDLVRRTQSFDYAQAVAWLHAEFGAVVAGALVKKGLQADPPARPFTPAENVIKAAVSKQTDALGCDRYRVTIVPEGDGAKPFLPGKRHGSEERFYTRAELVDLIPWLRFENNAGKHIYLTPMDDAATYILLDDARLSMDELRRRGFQPCLVQRTSWEKSQVVFKVPRELDRTAVMAVFNELNKRYGDEAMTGLRHPMRMAGFRNMKSKHTRNGQRPFVEVVQAVNRFCTRCTALVEQVIRAAQQAAETASRPGPSRR